MDPLPATAPGNLPPVGRLPRCRGPLPPRHLVAVVVADHQSQVGGSAPGDGQQTSQVHPLAAIAIQHGDLQVGAGECQSQPQRRGLSHGRRSVDEIEGVSAQLHPLAGRTHGRNDNLTGPPTPMQSFQVSLQGHWLPLFPERFAGHTMRVTQAVHDTLCGGNGEPILSAHDPVCASQGDMSLSVSVTLGALHRDRTSRSSRAQRG